MKIALALAATAVIALGCSDPKTPVNVGVRIADDICTAEAQQPDEPQLVALACTVEGYIVHVVMKSDAAAVAAPSATGKALAIKAGK